VSVLGTDPVQEPLKVKGKVGYPAENMGFCGCMTARENLACVAELDRMRDSGGKIDDVPDRVGLSSGGDRGVSQDSGGMRQRPGFAVVLEKDPKIAFLDEPTLGLDPDVTATMLEMITGLPGKRGLTVILSEDILHLMEKVASGAGIPRKGKLPARGTIAVLASGAGLEPCLEAVNSRYFHRGRGRLIMRAVIRKELEAASGRRGSS
jgi:ABC-2 type transport system ATP-binding protein